MQLPGLGAVGPVNPDTGKWCREQHGISWNMGTAVLGLVGLGVLCQLQGMLEASQQEKSPPGMVPGEDLEVPVLSWVCGGIERASVLYVKIILALFISLELPKNTV